MILTKDSDQFQTDEWVWKLFDLDTWFDPCPLVSTPLVNGLTIDWCHRTFVNPPYSNPLPWCIKAVEESKKGHDILLLLKLDPSTKWFKELVSGGGRVLFINERLRYRTGKASPFPSCLVYLEGKKVIKDEE